MKLKYIKHPQKTPLDSHLFPWRLLLKENCAGMLSNASAETSSRSNIWLLTPIRFHLSKMTSLRCSPKLKPKKIK